MINCAGKYINTNNGNEINKLLEANLSNITNVINAAVNSGCKNIINTGTIWQYQKKRKCPVNFYAATKDSLENILNFYQNQFNLKIINLYLSDTYGPNDDRNKLISVIERSIRKNELLVLTNKKKILDYIHIEDLVELYLEIIIKLTKLKKTNIFYRYFPRGERIYMKEIINMIIKKKIRLNYKWSKSNPNRKYENLNPSILNSNFQLHWKYKVLLNNYFDDLINKNYLKKTLKNPTQVSKKKSN